MNNPLNLGPDNDKPGYKTAADGHVYHKSATANATTAPTNEATIANALKLDGLNAAEAEFITCIEYEWNLQGDKGIERETFCDKYGYELTEYDSFIQTPLVLTRLSERGIPPQVAVINSQTSKEAKRSKLSPLQLRAAVAIMDLVDQRPIKKKLADLGITSQMYAGWLKDENFKNFLAQRAESLLGDISHEAHLSLVDRVMAGDMKAIEYYNEMRGYYTRASAASTGNDVDFKQMVIRIIEIVVDEVSNPKEAAAISERLKGLVAGHQAVGNLPMPEEVITEPEIATPREMTPEVQALMKKGAGYNT